MDSLPSNRENREESDLEAALHYVDSEVGESEVGCDQDDLEADGENEASMARNRPHCKGDAAFAVSA